MLLALEFSAQNLFLPIISISNVDQSGSELLQINKPFQIVKPELSPEVWGFLKSNYNPINDASLDKETSKNLYNKIRKVKVLNTIVIIIIT